MVSKKPEFSNHSHQSYSLKQVVNSLLVYILTYVGVMSGGTWQGRTCLGRAKVRQGLTTYSLSLTFHLHHLHFLHNLYSCTFIFPLFTALFCPFSDFSSPSSVSLLSLVTSSLGTPSLRKTQSNLDFSK